MTMETRLPNVILRDRRRLLRALRSPMFRWQTLPMPARSSLALTTLMVLLAGCVGSGDRPLQLMSGAGPVYPAAARASGVEGEVLVRYRVTSAGAVTDVVVVQATPPAVFDEAAITAVKQFRYRPKQIAGQAVAVPAVTSTIRFRLDSDGQYPLPED